MKNELLLILVGLQIGSIAYVYFSKKENGFLPAAKYIAILLVLTIASLTAWTNWQLTTKLHAAVVRANGTVARPPLSNAVGYPSGKTSTADVPCHICKEQAVNTLKAAKESYQQANALLHLEKESAASWLLFQRVKYAFMAVLLWLLSMRYLGPYAVTWPLKVALAIVTLVSPAYMMFVGYQWANATVALRLYNADNKYKEAAIQNKQASDVYKKTIASCGTCS